MLTLLVNGLGADQVILGIVEIVAADPDRKSHLRLLGGIAEEPRMIRHRLSACRAGAHENGGDGDRAEYLDPLAHDFLPKGHNKYRQCCAFNVARVASIATNPLKSS